MTDAKLTAKWTVVLVGQARKAIKVLSKRAAFAFTKLLDELQYLGPYRKSWPNYSKLKGMTDVYHCHLGKGKPTYVVCWRITADKIIEVFYAGTHEKAPY